MNDKIAQSAPAFGGPWTERKLAILERYLDAYTTALMRQPFELWYIDAFAGTGRVDLSADEQGDIRQFVSGSVERAINIDEKPFDTLILVEQDPVRCVELENLKGRHRNRNIVVVNSDANAFLTNLGDDWRGRRGVLFLDPFATQVEWATLERVAAFGALDTWILFPIAAVVRMLPQSRVPDEIDEMWVARLNTVFGDDSWRNLYRQRRQPNLFVDEPYEREPGIDELLGIYKNKLSDLFGNRFLEESRTLRNSRNSALFEFMFCAGHPAGARIAKDIAGHILRNL